MNQWPDDDEVTAATRRWIERAVLGLNLCPFAGRPWREARVRIRVSQAERAEHLAEALALELRALEQSDPAILETTLLVHPRLLNDFFDYNDFLEIADQLLDDMDLTGIVQIASFHPRYQFADSTIDDPANYSNRSPYPMLHLLREDSIEAATAGLPDPEAIYQRNIKTLRALGLAACRELIE